MCHAKKTAQIKVQPFLRMYYLIKYTSDDSYQK